MLASRDRSRLQLHRLADGPGHAQDDRRLRSQVHAGLRIAQRAVRVAATLAAFGAAALLARLSPSRDVRRARLVWLTSWLSRSLLRILNLRVTVRNLSGIDFTGKDRCLLVCNHMSYLDPACMMAVAPAVFVTSREVEATPFLGHVSRAGGCLFVERRRKTALLHDIEALSAVLNQGYNVGVFPEGSTSDGGRFLPWKSSLLESAMRARCRVVPMCLRYDRIDGVPFGPANRDSVAWYGDMSFFPHLLAVLRTRAIDATVTVFPPLPFRTRPSRHDLTARARRIIEDSYRT